MATVAEKLVAALDDAPVLSFAFWNGAKLYLVSLRPEEPQGSRAYVAEASPEAVLSDPEGAVKAHVTAAFDFWRDRA